MDNIEGALWITSISNQHCQRIRTLATSKGRKVDRAFLVEGDRSLHEAAEKGWHPQLLAFSKSFREKIKTDSKLSDLFKHAGKAIMLPDQILNKLSVTDTAPGCIAVFAIPSANGIEAFINTFSCFLVLDRIADPGNLGTLLRSASAFNCGLVILEGCVDIWAPKVIRSSMGAVFDQKFLQVSAANWRDICVEHNIRIAIAAAQDENMSALVFGAGKTAIVIGNEVSGVSHFWRDAANAVLSIPMPGRVESLNAAVAGSIFAFEWSRQKR